MNEEFIAMRKDAFSRLDDFELEIQRLVNRMSLENLCDFPDYTLAKYIRYSLEIFAKTINGTP